MLLREKMRFASVSPVRFRCAAALVVPAFEYARQEDGRDPRMFPRDKQVRAPRAGRGGC